MTRSYHPALLSMLLALVVVLVQVVQFVILRNWWWGWPAIGSGVLLHSTVWGTIASAFLGVWFTRPSVSDGSAVYVKTAARPLGVVAGWALGPFVLVVVGGQLSLGMAISVLGRTGYGTVDWLFVLAAACWPVSGVLWGYWIGMKAPWKLSWFLGPGVPVLILALGTTLPLARGFLPILPNASVFGAIPLAGRLYALMSALSVLLLLCGAVAGVRLVVVSLAWGCATLVMLPTFLPTMVGYVEDPDSLTELCADGVVVVSCVPAGYRAIESRFHEVVDEVSMQNPSLFSGIHTVSAIPDDRGDGVLYVAPLADWDGESMLADESDLRFALAAALAKGEPCVGEELGNALALRLADNFGVDESQVLRADLAESTATMDSVALRDAESLIRAMDARELADLVVGRRTNPELCQMTAEQFVAGR